MKFCTKFNRGRATAHNNKMKQSLSDDWMEGECIEFPHPYNEAPCVKNLSTYFTSSVVTGLLALSKHSIIRWRIFLHNTDRHTNIQTKIRKTKTKRGLDKIGETCLASATVLRKKQYSSTPGTLYIVSMIKGC